MLKTLKERYNKFGEIHPVIKEWIETIERVNKVNMPQYAEDCIEIAKTWEIAE